VCRRWREVGEDPRLWTNCLVSVSGRFWRSPSLSNVINCGRLKEVSKIKLTSSLSKKDVLNLLAISGLKELVVSDKAFGSCSDSASVLLKAIYRCGDQLNIKSLDLSRNGLQYVHVDHVSRAAARLETLNFSKCQFLAFQSARLLEAITKNSSRLINLDISCNDLTYITQDTMAKMAKKFESLNVMQSKLASHQSGMLFRAIGESSKLKHLNISETRLYLVNPERMKVLPNLKTLNLRNTSLSIFQIRNILNNIRQGCKLRELDLSENDLSEVKPELLKRIVSRLNTFKVRKCELTTEQITAIFAGINKKSKLTNLDISDNKLNLVEPIKFAVPVANLHTFEVENSKLKTYQAEAIFTAIKSGTNLTNLNISDNKLSAVESGLLSSAVNMLENVNTKHTWLLSSHQKEGLNFICSMSFVMACCICFLALLLIFCRSIL